MRRLLLGLIFGLAMVSTVWASDIMAGSWQSTTGSTIRIPAGRGNFDLVVTHRDGKRFLLAAHWIEVGRHFEFTNEYGKVVRASINPRDPNRVRVITVETGSTNYWRRWR